MTGPSVVELAPPWLRKAANIANWDDDLPWSGTSIPQGTGDDARDVLPGATS